MRHILFCPLRDQNLMKSITLEILWKPSFVSFITLEFLSSRAFNQLLFWYLTSGIQYLQDYTKEKEYFQIKRIHKRKRIFSNHCHTKSFIWYQSTKEKKRCILYLVILYMSIVSLAQKKLDYSCSSSNL